jgi:hypothetical protein
MNYLDRYRNGECEKVWNELQALGPSVRREPHISQAREVATETMRRVKWNCEQIISRLHVLGYKFGTYPDGSRRSYVGEPISSPSRQMGIDCSELEEQAGTIPLSLMAFWQEVGAVDLVGMHPAWTDGLDPLVVDPPEGALSFLCEEEEETEAPRMFAGLAPDDLHKDNTSGGDPYGVHLPNPLADFPFLYERHNLHFVPYLRLAILRCGGFPGLDGRRKEFKPLGGLVAGLEPF